VVFRFDVSGGVRPPATNGSMSSGTSSGGVSTDPNPIGKYIVDPLSTGFLMSNYSNPSDNFKPTNFINLAHSISGKSNFAVNQAYGFAVGTVPVVLTVLGFLALCGLTIGLTLRYCPVACFCCKCYPHTNPRDNDQAKAQSVQCQRRGVLTFFYLFLIIELTTEQFSFIGNTNIGLAVNEFNKGVSQVQTIFANITGSGTQLTAAAVHLQTNYAAAQGTCASVAAYGTFVDGYRQAVGTFAASLAPVKPNLDLLSTNLQLYAVKYTAPAFYVLWALGTASGCALVLFQLLKRKAPLKVAVGLGMLTFFVQIVVCLAFMVATAALGDICVRPSWNMLTNIPTGALQNMAVYYSSCHGFNVIGDNIATAQGNAYNLGLGVIMLAGNVSSPCYGDPNVVGMAVNLNNIYTTFSAMEGAMACGPLQTLWFRIVNTSVCTDLFTGFYTMWTTQLVTSLFLFGALVLGAISWQYYDLPVMGYAIFVPAGTLTKVGVDEEDKDMGGGTGELEMLQLGGPDDVQAYGGPVEDPMRADVAVLDKKIPVDVRYKP